MFAFVIISVTIVTKLFEPTMDVLSTEGITSSVYYLLIYYMI